MSIFSNDIIAESNAEAPSAVSQKREPKAPGQGVARTVLRGLKFAAAFCAGASCYLSVATAQVPSEPPPVYSTVDRNNVDLVSGQVIHSETILSIGQEAAGGLTFERIHTGRHERDNFTGTLNDVGTCAVVSLGGSSQDCDSMAANGAALEDLGGGLYKYTMKDGTVAEFSAAWASTLPTRAEDGRVTSITYPNGERLDFYYETVATDTVHRKSVVSNRGYQIKFQQAAPNSAAYAVNMAVDTCDPAAWTCAGLTEEVLPFSTVSSYSVAASTITITQPSGLRTVYTLDTAASPDRVTAVKYEIIPGYPFATWTYSYVDDTGADTRTTTVTDPLLNTRVVVSKLSTERVISKTDELGRTTTFQYDASDRLTRITRPEGNYTQITRDSRGNVTEVRLVAKPGSGLSDIVRSATFPATCDGSNRLICNKPTSVTDERGKVTDFTYDTAHGGVLTITRPDPDGAGSAVRPETRIAYDDFYARYKDATGTIVTASTPVYVPLSGSACAAGEAPSCVGTADETIVTIDYGDMSPAAANNLLAVAYTMKSGDNSLTETTTWTFDAVGNIVSVDGSLSGTDDTTHYRYDTSRRRTGIIEPDPDGAGPLKFRAQRTSYNANGYVTTVERGTVNGVTDTDWANFVTLEKTQTEYDFLNRPVKKTRIANGATHALTQYSYDQLNRLECTAMRMNPVEFASPPAACTLDTAGSFGNDRITKNFYDAAGQITKVTEGLGTPAQRDEKTITYTTNGLIATLVDGNGNLTTYEYDGFDRRKKVFYPTAMDGSVSSTTDYEEFTYQSATNLLVQVRARDGQTISLSHDDLGRMTFVDKPVGEDDLTVDYDNLDRMVSAVQTGHALSFIYDALGRMISETGPLGTIAHDYDAAGRRTRLTWPGSNFYVDYDYDLTGAMTQVRENGATSGPGVLAVYAYDDLGRRTSITRGNGTVTSYTYDNAQRLESLTHDFAGTADDQTLSFGRNPLAQIMSRTSTNAGFDWDDYVAESTSYTANGLNQYSSIGVINLSYDGRGNLTSDGVKTYAYDVFNRLTSVSGGGSLEYDPLSRLYEVSDGVATTKFLTDGVDVIAEYDAGGTTLLRRYVHGQHMDEPLVWYEGSGTTDRRWLAADERGSIIAVTDGTGAVTAKNTYDEFGMPDSANQGRFQYTGQMWLGEVGLYHYKYRTYAPGIGRFLQTDPIGYVAGMNLYAYVENDPVNKTDPWGLEEKKDCKPEDSDCDVVRSTGRRVRTGWGFGGGAGYRPLGGRGGGGGRGNDVDDVIVVTAPKPEKEEEELPPVSETLFERALVGAGIGCIGGAAAGGLGCPIGAAAAAALIIWNDEGTWARAKRNTKKMFRKKKKKNRGSSVFRDDFCKYCP